jgi:CRP-like cAMP-binding protein
MKVLTKFAAKEILQTLVPFHTLSPTHLDEVAQKTTVESVRSGRYLFREGDRDNQSVYVLEGGVNLLSGPEVVGNIVGGTDAARHPIAHQQPRRASACAHSPCVIARIDSSLLNLFLTWDQSGGYEVNEINEDEDEDWMTRMLQSPAFLKLPPSNIQRLLMSVQSVEAKAGDEIIRQGSEGKHFYIIKSGRCVVSRKSSPNATEIRLAELADGDVFGEEALVSDAKRNATVTMATDGTLMRLAKSDFVKLLNEPLVERVTYAQALELDPLATEWLDVRLPGEFEASAIPGSRNIPLSALRYEADSLNKAVRYIVCCDNGQRSESAAFILSQRGLSFYLLAGGLRSVPAANLSGESAISPETVPEATANAEVYDLANKRATRTEPEEDTREAMAAAPDLDMPARLEAEMQTVRTQLEEARGRAEMLEHTLESAEVASETRSEGLVSAVEERYRAELEDMRERVREQTLELEYALQEARIELGQAQAESVKLQQRLQQLELEGKGRENDLRQSQDLVEELEADERKLTAELEEARNRSEAGQRQLEELRSQLEAQSSHHTTLLDDMRQAYEEKLTQLQRHCEELEKERDLRVFAASELEQSVAAVATDLDATPGP